MFCLLLLSFKKLVPVHLQPKPWIVVITCPSVSTIALLSKSLVVPKCLPCREH